MLRNDNNYVHSILSLSLNNFYDIDALPNTRLNVLEQGQPLAKHLGEMDHIIEIWFEEMHSVLHDIELQTENATTLEQMKMQQELFNVSQFNIKYNKS